MSFLSINCGLNQIVNIHKNVFLNIVDDCVKHSKEIKLIKDTKIELSEKQDKVSIILSIKVNNENNLRSKIVPLIERIENAVLNLIDIRPENIQIYCKGTY